MATVEISVSYLKLGKSESNTFKVRNVDALKLFKNAMDDARVFATLKGGNVEIVQFPDSLYISYLDVPDTDLIDRQYRIEK
jgi:hypothetical protein